MKSLIIYSSLSGNTEKIAMAIKDEVEDCEIISAKDFRPQMITNFDVFYIGYWVDKGDCDMKSRGILESLNQQNIVLFGTLGAAENTAYYNLIKTYVEEHAKHQHILGHFLCQGKVSDTLIERYKEMLKKNPDDEHMKQQVANYENGKSHPDEMDIINAKEFARSIG